MVVMIGRMRMSSVGSRSVSYSVKARARSWLSSRASGRLSYTDIDIFSYFIRELLFTVLCLFWLPATGGLEHPREAGDSLHGRRWGVSDTRCRWNG